MLVLSRRIGEKLVIGDQITVSINRVSGNRVSLGIDAPPHVRVVRSELRGALLDILHDQNPPPSEDTPPSDAGPRCDDDSGQRDLHSGNDTSEAAFSSLACR